MGYRSSVQCVIYPLDRDAVNSTPEDYFFLKTLMNTLFKNITDMFEENIKWYDDNKVLMFDIPDVKWYESFPDVKAFGEMLKWFQDTAYNTKYSYEFVRIGEELDDNEIINSDNSEYMLRVSREITVSF
jgi:hypothetical protein